jgi:GntR family transcriptional regulator
MNQKGIYLYRRVEMLLKTRILTGQYEPGQKLPTANELAAEFDVSKITISNALANLQREDLVWGKQGKGVFVSDSIPVSKQFVVSGSLNKILQDAERYKVEAFDPEIVVMGEVRFSKDMKKFFGVSSDYRTGRLQRLRVLKDTPIYYLENFLSPELALCITRQELQKKPLLRILRDNFDIRPARGEMYIQSIPAESDIAKLLQVESYDPIMHIQVYYWEVSGEPLEAVNSFMRADYFKYKIELDECDME